MPTIRRRKIWWEGVPDASSYVVYVSRDGNAFSPGNFAWESTPGILCRSVAGKTDLIIPDEWPEFPMEPGTYYVGITARDDLGNQSDPFVSSALFRFHAPPTPPRAGIESL